MTQRGKCDVCRQRKCDEKRPQCSQCAKKNRHCQYQFGTKVRFAHLGALPDPGLTVVEQTTLVGNGGSHTLSPMKDLDLRLDVLDVTTITVGDDGGDQPACDENGIKTVNVRGHDHQAWPWRLRIDLLPTIYRINASREWLLGAQYYDAIGSELTQQNASTLWGSWVAQVPLRLGNCAVLDDSVQCLVAASEAFQDRTEPKAVRASKKYARALASLQQALNVKTKASLTDILVAIRILLLFETVLGFSDFRWVQHSRGLIDLIAAAGPLATIDETHRSLFWTSLPQDFADAILSDSLSRFDSPVWLESELFTTPGDHTASQVAYRVVQQQMIQIPRLMKQVRTACAHPFDLERAESVLEFAEQLYMGSLGNKLDATLVQFAEWRPTKNRDLAQYLPESLQFTTLSAYETFSRLWYCRILLIGLWRTMRSNFPAVRTLDAKHMAAEEVRTATLITAAIEFAESATGPLPLAELLHVLPVQIAYGTWWWTEMDACSGADVDEAMLEKARFMKELCLEKHNKMLRKWGGDEKVIALLESSVRAMRGGPWVPWYPVAHDEA